MKKVLVITDNDLLVIGIERLLKKSADFAIQKTTSHDESKIISFIQETASEVVIVDGAYEKNGSFLTHLLNGVKDLRVLIMHIDSNRIQIYDKREGSLEPSTNLADYL